MKLSLSSVATLAVAASALLVTSVEAASNIQQITRVDGCTNNTYSGKCSGCRYYIFSADAAADKEHCFYHSEMNRTSCLKLSAPVRKDDINDFLTKVLDFGSHDIFNLQNSFTKQVMVWAWAQGALVSYSGKVIAWYGFSFLEGRHSSLGTSYKVKPCIGQCPPLEIPYCTH